MRKYKGVTLVELLVSVLILALIMAGLANVFYTSRRYIALSRSRAQAAEFSKKALDNLSSYVRQDTLSSSANPLCTSAGCTSTNKQGETIGLNYITYNSSYNVSNVSITAPEMRRVKIKVNWTEPVN
jgi:prepilin-type N-terminal cleavage/methylation domain-containing protein